MKKRTIVIIIILIAFIVVPYVVGVIDRHVISFDELCVPAYNPTIQYPQEENTVIMVGNGRFQVMKYKENEKHEPYSDYYLFDVKKREIVLSFVTRYTENKKTNHFYFWGPSGAYSLDYRLESISYLSPSMSANIYDELRPNWISLVDSESSENSKDTESS